MLLSHFVSFSIYRGCCNQQTASPRFYRIILSCLMLLYYAIIIVSDISTDGTLRSHNY